MIAAPLNTRPMLITLAQGLYVASPEKDTSGNENWTISVDSFSTALFSNRIRYGLSSFLHCPKYSLES